MYFWYTVRFWADLHLSNIFWKIKKKETDTMCVVLLGLIYLQFFVPQSWHGGQQPNITCKFEEFNKAAIRYHPTVTMTRPRICKFYWSQLSRLSLPARRLLFIATSFEQPSLTCCKIIKKFQVCVYNDNNKPFFFPKLNHIAYLFCD